MRPEVPRGSNQPERTQKIRFAAMEEIGERQREPLYICSTQTIDYRFPECPPHFLFFFSFAVVSLILKDVSFFATHHADLGSAQEVAGHMSCVASVLAWSMTVRREGATCVYVLAHAVRGDNRMSSWSLAGASASSCTTAPLRAMSIRWDLERLFRVLANCRYVWLGALRMH